MTTTFDASFREAVAAVDSGDVPKLSRLLAAEPLLARERLELPGDWLKTLIGDALDGFFQRPYLLWFIAEDPVRNGSLPANDAGADLTAQDTVHEATPLGWAEYAQEAQTDPVKAARYSAIAKYLRHVMRVDVA